MQVGTVHTISFTEEEVAEALREFAEKKLSQKLHVEDTVTGSANVIIDNVSTEQHNLSVISLVIVVSTGQQA